MALPKKGLRKIRIGEFEYGWLIRKKPTYSEGAFESSMRIAIQRIDELMPGVLLVETNISRPDNWISSHQVAVTPGMVRSMILGAISEGWSPQDKGTFNFNYQVEND